MINKIELLAPAGDLEKLKIAVIYGADAVYIGGHTLGLRAKSKNFSDEDMIEGIEFAHKHNVKVYITANIFAHNADFEGIEAYFEKLGSFGCDAIIISDPGIFAVCRQVLPKMEIHISTQANNTNYQSVKFWHDLGAKRVVLARELSFDEISTIKEKVTNITLEAFVHGAMCISYSGRCLLSNYMTNRDANKGECSHACRWKYNLVEETRPGEFMPIEEDERGTYIYNSKDLCMIEYIPDLIKAGIESFKIEGRMKTPYYVASVVKAYRNAIDDYFVDEMKYETNKENYLLELQKCSHRYFTTGFYHKKPDGNEQIYTNNSYIRNYDFCGVVLSYDQTTLIATIEQRNKMVVGDSIEILRSHSNNINQEITFMTDEQDIPIDQAPHPQQIIKIKINEFVKEYDIIRKKILD